MAIEAGEGEESPPSGGDLVKFLLGTGSWFGAFGLHGVLFSSLLVVYLEESEVRVGVAQSAVMLPAVFLILIGGAVADRVDRRRLLIWMHCMGAWVTLGLAFMVYTGSLNYAAVIVYALALGSAQAFGNPARDAMLSEVAAGDLGRSVASMTVVQWGSQAVGALTGGLARLVGVTAALCG